MRKLSCSGVDQEGFPGLTPPPAAAENDLPIFQQNFAGYLYKGNVGKVDQQTFSAVEKTITWCKADRQVGKCAAGCKISLNGVENQSVLAHPERYFCVQDTPELLYEFREMGAVLQINKGSVFGRFGEEAERTARFLLENRLAGCVASDAHGADYRTTDMRPVRQFLEERYGEAYAQLLLKVNPRRILEDRQIFYEPSPERKRKRRWFL